MPGVMLTLAWLNMDREAQRLAVRQVAEQLRYIHSAPEPTQGFSRSTQFFDSSSGWFTGELERLYSLVDQVIELPFVDGNVMREVRELLGRGQIAFRGQQHGALIHGDLHFDNILWDGSVSAVLDLERASYAPLDLELDILLRFCRFPYLYVAREHEHLVTSELFDSVPRWLAEDYPEMFEHPYLEDRLNFFSLAHDLGQLTRYPPDKSPDQLAVQHPYNRIRATIRGLGPASLLKAAENEGV